MNYEEAVKFLYSRLPMYSRIGSAAYKTDLTNTLLLCKMIDHPEKKFQSVHIAGTNGKGSTSHMLAAIFQESDYRTGLYTSPHLKDFRERIRIDGEMISKEEVAEFVSAYRDPVIKIGCSFFEWTVALAFHHFAKHKVDVAIIETGLGGRLDSTNVITPVLSIITNISYDHADLLGDTLEKIATEKAGIIKQRVPVVIGEHQEDNIFKIFLDAANKKHASLSCADDEWAILSSRLKPNSLELAVKDVDGELYSLELDLTGNYQEKNVLTVLEATLLLDQERFLLPKEAIISALSQVKKLTGLKGRWEVLHKKPLVIADVAHNMAGLLCAMAQLQKYSCKKLHLVLGFVKEKDIDLLLPLFPKDASYYFCKPDIPRGLSVDVLMEKANVHGLKGRGFDSVSSAYQDALHNAANEDVIFVGGSTFVVAEVI